MASLSETYLQVLQDLDKAGYSMDIDGGSIIFTNKKTGMKYIDASNGIGPNVDKMMFQADLNAVSEQIKKLITVPVNENQFTALVSFAHHIGVENFANSGVLATLNKGNYADVVKKMQRWRTGATGPGTRTQVRQDYIERRQYEAELFSTPGWLNIQKELDQYLSINQNTTLSFKQQREILIGIKDRAYREKGIFRNSNFTKLPKDNTRTRAF